MTGRKLYPVWLASLLCAALLLGGCGGKRTVTLYLPANGGLAAASARVEDSPEGLVRALADAGALPEAEWSYLYCVCRAEEYTLRGDTRRRRIVWLDIAEPLGKALAGMEDERPSVQALANTFLDYYGAEAVALTVEGVNLQTLREYYDHGIMFDEYAETE